MVCKTGPFCLAGVVQENLILTFSLFRLPFCPPLLLLLIGMVTSGEGPVERQTLSPRGRQVEQSLASWKFLIGFLLRVQGESNRPSG